MGAHLTQYDLKKKKKKKKKKQCRFYSPTEEPRGTAEGNNCMIP